MLARLYHDDGRPDDALALLDEVDEISADEDVINFAISRGLRARIGSERGDLAEAERLAREGLEFALATDFPWTRGDAHLDLTYVLACARRNEEAQVEALRGHRGVREEAGRRKARREPRAAGVALGLDRKVVAARPLVPRARVVPGIVAEPPENLHRSRRARPAVAIGDDLGARGQPEPVASSSSG